ncbi:MAG: restriction endonuclease subunit S [Candidatus Ruthia sp.]|jgi:type I restriction enzyme S subunit|nr:restriction endonuclease subunit S [Candidatus Ruthturnera sp.]
MTSEWKTEKLGDICDVKIGKTPPRSQEEWFSLKNGLSWASIKDMGNNGKYLESTKEYLTHKAVKQFKIPIVKKGTILLSFKLTVGRLSIANCDMCTNEAIAQLSNPKINRDYLYYYLKNFNYDSLGSTSSIATAINSTILKSLPVVYPPLLKQKKIAYILSILDEKIELNYKMNQTLEEIVQSLFKSWFVDFDPVQAKVNATSNADFDRIAKELGINRTTLDFFPDGFEESEFGMTPRGWKVTQLGECDFSIESGKRPKGGIDKELKNGIPSVGAESVISTGGFNFSKVKYVTHEFALKAKKGWVQNMDVALYKDGGRPGLFMPRVGLYGRSFPFKNFMINEHVFLLRSKQLGQYFLYGLITSDNILNQLISRGSAKAAQPGLNQTEVKSSKFIFPSVELIESFNKAVKPVIEKQLENGKQIQTLQQTRDTLLPKLLSGELDVSELELDNVTH